MEHLAYVVPMVQGLDFPVAQEGGAQEGDQLVAVLKAFDFPVPVQVIESAQAVIPSWLAEQLVEVVTVVSFASLQRTAEQSIDIPGTGRRRGGGGGLQGLHPGHSSTASVVRADR